MLTLAVVLTVASALTSTLPRSRRLGGGGGAARRFRPAAPSMLFLEECVWKDNALQWAKETSRTKLELPAVVALYDVDSTCVYVGAVEDAPFAVASLAVKHGVANVTALRREEFPKEVYAEAEGRRMMDLLVAAWLGEATEANPGGLVPVGNREDGWATYDKDANPFLAGVIGTMPGASGEAVAPKSPEEEALDKMQRRRESMKQRLDEAMAKGDEKLAMNLLSRLNDLNDDLSDEPEAPDSFL